VLNPELCSFIFLVASVEGGLYKDWKPEEVYALTEWLITKAGLFQKMLRGEPPAHRLAFTELDVPELIPPSTKTAKAKVVITPSIGLIRTLLSGTVGGVLLIPPSLKRRAILALVQLGEDPESICKAYLDSDRGYYADAFNFGVADVIRAYAGQMSPSVVKELIEQGLKIPRVPTRKAFYSLGADLFGPAYWKRAQSDSARTIREWATKRISALSEEEDRVSNGLLLEEGAEQGCG